MKLIKKRPATPAPPRFVNNKVLDSDTLKWNVKVTLRSASTGTNLVSGPFAGTGIAYNNMLASITHTLNNRRGNTLLLLANNTSVIINSEDIAFVQMDIWDHETIDTDVP